MHTAKERHRHLHILAIDELPVFKSSADILTTVALPQSRKFALRTLACAQGASSFPAGPDDPLLQSFLSLAGTRFFFRHNSELDCALFGRHVTLPVYSPMIEKYRHLQPMQMTDGHEIVELVDVSETATESDTQSEAHARGTNTVRNWNESSGSSDSQTFRDAVLSARAEVKNRQTGHGGADGKTEQDTRSSAHTKGHSRGVTRKQQLLPIIRTQEVCTSVSFLEKTELEAMSAALIANQQTGQAVMHASGSPPVQVTFPYAADPFALTPNFAKRKEAEHQAIQERSPAFATIDHIQRQRRLLLDALLRRLTAIAAGRDGELNLRRENPDEPPADSSDGF